MHRYLPSWSPLPPPSPPHPSGFSQNTNFGCPLPGKSHGQRSLVGYNLWGQKESDTTEHTHTHTCNLLKLYKNIDVCLYRYVGDRCQETNTGLLSFFFFSIGIHLLYNVMLVSAVKQKNPLYVYIHPLPLEPPSHPLPHPSRPSQSPELRSLCYIAISHKLFYIP